MSVMLQSLPASCGLPVASLKSQPDSYGQLLATVKSLPADLSLQNSHSGTDYHQPMSQHSDISRFSYPEYPLSQHRYPACPAPGMQ
ncbi:hypothetical protein Tco_0964019 [Tanacetum coccineum]